MSRDEIEENNDLYGFFQRASEFTIGTARALTEAQRYALLDSDPSHLTQQEITDEIRLVQAVLTEHILFGGTINNLRDAHPDFPATITRDDLQALLHTPDGANKELLNAPRNATIRRMIAAGYVEKAP